MKMKALNCFFTAGDKAVTLVSGLKIDPMEEMGLLFQFLLLASLQWP